ncbi:MAG: serine/threonine-protein phosphatase [Phycisphaerae bacterium]|nr:serine/threonine-protein phosphatase [Phycisphaerae bacterium]
MPSPARPERHFPIYVGIFFIFAPVGLLLGLMPDQPWGWGMSLLSAVFGGVLSVLWSWTFQTRRYWMIAVLLLGSATSGFWLFRPLAAMGLSRVGASIDPTARRVTLMILAIAFLAVGFTIIIRVMAGNERRAARLQTELDLASRIHRTLVPALDARTPFVHVFGKSEPSSEMGGDLIDLVVREGSADLYLADISGHGVRAGVLMAMVKSALRSSLLDQRPSLDAVARGLNRVLAQVAEPDMFATFACLRLDSARRVDYTIAGHWPILHVCPARRELVELPGESMPLGVDPAEGFVSSSTTAERGDLFVLLTDGLLEVMNDSHRAFGMDRFKSRLLELADRPLDDLYSSLIREARAFGVQADDQTLLLARVL